MSAILELRAVSKQFSSVKALDQVSLAIEPGRVFGLLGPNGAGKTTLIRIVTGIIGPDEGEIRFQGEPLNGRHASRIGYMPEERGLYKKMMVGEHLVYLGRLKGLGKKDAKQRIEHWLERLEMDDWWSRRIEDLSKGMQQKVQFISTVLHDPQLLILDEPFSGLDPLNTNMLKDEIDGLRRKGTTIIFSTHRMEQVEEICDEIALINKGSKILEGPIDEIRERYKKHIFSVGFRGGTYSAAHHDFEIMEALDDQLVVRLRNGFSGNDLLSVLIAQGADITSFKEILPSVDQIFIQLVKEQTDHA